MWRRWVRQRGGYINLCRDYRTACGVCIFVYMVIKRVRRKTHLEL